MRVQHALRITALGFFLAVQGCALPATSPLARAPERPTAAAPADTGGGREAQATLEDGARPDCDEPADPAPAPGAAKDEPAEGDVAPIDDGFEAPPDAKSPDEAAADAPFADLSTEEITARLRDDIESLGPMSIGQAHSGVLVSGVRMPEGANWELVSPGHAWGTKETVDGLTHAIDVVAGRFPDTPKVYVGDISAKRGGHLGPHVSHQSGRDADVSYYLTEGHRWYAQANAKNLDRARTWQILRTLITDSDVDLVLVDSSVQRLLKSYAREIGEDPAWLDRIFQVGGKSRRPMIFHANGHATHFHVRFYSPKAQELGRRAYRYLLSRRLISPPTTFVTHTVKSGETLSHLAIRYKVTIDAIKKANGLKKDTLRMDRAYKIPQTGGIAMPARVVVPPRPVPPPIAASAVAGAKSSSVASPCRRASLR